MTTPVASRPRAPEGYGYSTEPEGMLAWNRVRDAIAAASVYWVGSVLPDGGSHTHSIWGGFVSSCLYIEGGEDTRWARNIAREPRVSFGVEADGLHISARGVAARAGAGPDFDALADAYGGKYQYRPESDDFWRITPSVVIALDMSSLEAFASSPTRFTFPERA